MKRLLRILFYILCNITLYAHLCVGMTHGEGLPTLGDTEREYLSPNTERKLGESIMQSIYTDPDYVDDDVSLEYLNHFGDKLAQAQQKYRDNTFFNFSFFIVRDPHINAFALPGGFIGLHTAFILAADTESQLAAVLSHEMGHVTQRHIARMVSQQKKDAFLPLASLLLAGLAMQKSPDAALALAAGGQGLAIQRQLDFSQDAEREADRVGLQIMRDSGYDPNGMIAFFERIESATRYQSSEKIPPFLRTHPMTAQRVADIQNRLQTEHFPKHVDDLSYGLFRARVRVLAAQTHEEELMAQTYFKTQLNTSSPHQLSAAYYGLSLVTLTLALQRCPSNKIEAADISPSMNIPANCEDRQDTLKTAQNYLKEAIKHSHTNRPNLFFTHLQLTLDLEGRDNVAALDFLHNRSEQASVGVGRATNRSVLHVHEDCEEHPTSNHACAVGYAKSLLKRSKLALLHFPFSFAITKQYVHILLANNLPKIAENYLREQVTLYPQHAGRQKILAEVYAKEGKQALSHIALAESYALSGLLTAALDQLNMARGANDASFYDQAIIDARERELKQQYQDELAPLKKTSPTPYLNKPDTLS